MDDYDKEIEEFQRRLRTDSSDQGELPASVSSDELDVGAPGDLISLAAFRAQNNEISLSGLLKSQLETKLVTINGVEVTADDYLTYLVLQGALTGQVEFADESVRHLNPKDWLKLVAWVYDRVDGKSAQSIQVEADLEKHGTTIEYVNNWRRPGGEEPGH